MNDKIREDFEAWVMENWPAQSLAKFNDGEYQGFTVQHCWEAWKASRDSLTIELPPMPKAQRSDEEATYSAGGCDMRHKCSKAIEAEGLKVGK